MLRASVAVEIGARRRNRETLDARADRNGNHVHFQPLVVANARVSARREKVDEAVLGRDVQPDIGIGIKKRNDDPRQDASGNVRRDVEAQGAGRPPTRTAFGPG